MSKPSELVQGTLDMMLLKILALEPLNGWAISLRLKQISGDVLGFSVGNYRTQLSVSRITEGATGTAGWRSLGQQTRALRLE